MLSNKSNKLVFKWIYFSLNGSFQHCTRKLTTAKLIKQMQQYMLRSSWPSLIPWQHEKVKICVFSIHVCGSELTYKSNFWMQLSWARQGRTLFSLGITTTHQSLDKAGAYIGIDILLYFLKLSANFCYLHGGSALSFYVYWSQSNLKYDWKGLNLS